MRNLRLCLIAMLLLFCTACWSRIETNAFQPTLAFVNELKAKAERLGESELKRFNELELASKNEVRFETIPNPVASAGSVYFKGYRDYTAVEVQDILVNNSYLHPITVVLLFKYRLMTTTARHSDFPTSHQQAEADQDFKPIREDNVVLEYRCSADGALVDPLPGLMPRDSAINPSWNLKATPDSPPVSPVGAPPVVLQDLEAKPLRSAE